MDPAHVHLFLNHVPLVGGIGALLLLAWGLLWRSIGVTRAALVAIVVVALLAIPAFVTGKTGDKAADDAALAGVIAIQATAAVALASLFAWRSTQRYPAFGAAAVLVVGIAASILIVRAASLGG